MPRVSLDGADNGVGVVDWRKQSFLELMSQLFSDLEFSTGSEARYRIPGGTMIVQFNFVHSGVPRLEKTTSKDISSGYSHEACQR